ncbi:MAG: DMT family transporter [Pseudomonadota bacterium]
MRQGFWAGDRPVWMLTLIVMGGGLPFGLLGMAGAQFAPARHMGALLPGSMPVFVAPLSAVFLGERFGRGRVAGLGIIVFGVACVVGETLFSAKGDATVLFGDALFLLAGVFWAIYTVAFRLSGLDPWHGAALICFWSSVLGVAIGIWACAGAPSVSRISKGRFIARDDEGRHSGHGRGAPRSSSVSRHQSAR